MPYLTNRGIIALGAAEDALTTAWVNAVVGDGGSVSAGRRTLVNDLISGLRTDSLISKLDRLWIFAAENTQSALRDLMAAAAATPQNSPSFSADDGYTGNGSNTSIDSNFNPGTAGGFYALNSAHLGVWAVTSGDSTTEQVHGWLDAGATTGASIAPHRNGVDFQRGTMNSELGGTLDSAVAAKHALINRSGASAIQLYVDGSSQGTDTDASNTLTGSVNIWFLARNFGGSVNQPTKEQIAAGHFGSSLSSTDAGNLWSRLRTYMTAVGVP